MQYVCVCAHVHMCEADIVLLHCLHEDKTEDVSLPRKQSIFGTEVSEQRRDKRERT